MSISEELTQPKLERVKCADTNSSNSTTFEYFNEKYDNFRKFIEELSKAYPEAAKVSNYLNILPLQEFREMILPKLMDAIMLHDDGDELKRNSECERVMCGLLNDNNFDIKRLSSGEMSKIIRYCILFCVLLSDP